MAPQDFIDALRSLERDRNPEPLAGLYDDRADVGNTATTQTHTGPDGARAFWTGYRDAFGTIESTFRTTLDDDDGFALEWVSEGTLAGGEPITYEGVTIVRTENGRITRSTAYFDPRAILSASAA